jgi:hypothetical protein
MDMITAVQSLVIIKDKSSLGMRIFPNKHPWFGDYGRD